MIKFNPHRLKERRQALNISQMELSQLTGIQRTHLSKIENGKTIPRADTIVRIAEALKVPIEFFFN